MISAKERERVRIFARVKRGELQQKEATSRLRDYISVHPNGSGIHLSQRQSDVPTDLYLEDGTKPAADLVPFVMVAYGLSNLGLQVPDAETPETMTPMDDPPQRRRITHEELYGE